MSELVPIESHLSFQDTLSIGKVLAESGFFADVKQVAQAVVKVLYGQELGIGPVSAMRSVYIVKGKPCLEASLISALIKRSGRYNYRIIHLGNESCEIAFYERGQELQPHSLFTMEDAKLAGLSTGDNWKKYPRNMLFARALTNGARWHTPDVFGGAVYTPDELQGESAPVPDIVDGQAEEIHADPIPQPAGSMSQIGQIKATTPEERKPISRQDAMEYWNWATLDMAQSHDEALKALGVSKLSEFLGNLDDAKAANNAYTKAKSEAVPATAE